MTDAYYIELSELKQIVQNENNSDLDYAEKENLDTAISNLRNKIESTSFINKNPSVDAQSIWDDWFKTVETDVFISHSSTNGKEAVQFANWLNANFGLKSFVDSQFWLRIDELQKEFDRHCQYKKDVFDRNGNSHKENFYDYDKRNKSTAHVHAILFYALTKMIERTPYFIFIKSTDSITFADSIENIASPWIFHELAVVDLIHHTRLHRFSEEADFSSLEVHYPLLGDCLKELNSQILNKWKQQKNINKTNALDFLDKILKSTIDG